MTCAAMKPFKPAPTHTDSRKFSAKNIGGQEVMWFILAAVNFCSRKLLVNHYRLIVYTYNFLYVAISFVLCATVVLLSSFLLLVFRILFAGSVNPLIFCCISLCAGAYHSCLTCVSNFFVKNL